jgi:hypothetical protein
VRKKCSKEIVWMRKNSKNIWEWEWKEVWKRVAETASFLIIWLCERRENSATTVWLCVHMHCNS